ncbi:MAG TPA: sulfotransferase domain-containing protein [Candidatus Binataceae bacterium]|nr:sulfotransferase domain-containing protein [Candidatus Binataceae bacterium]
MTGDAQHKLPDFIGVGPPRTGTTWLDRLLRERCCLPARVKETQFFIWRYEFGIEWYAEHFRACAPGMKAGEFSPLYFPSAAARERIFSHIPRCRIICTLRDPVERFYSHYRLWRRVGSVKAPFEQVAATHEGLLAFTQYASNVRAWRERFGMENVLVAIYEDSKSDRQAYIDRVCDFIGIARIDLAGISWEAERVQPADLIPRSRRLAFRAIRVQAFLMRRRLYRVVNACMPLFDFCMSGGGSFPPLEPEVEASLRRRFLPEVERVEELLGRELPAWRREPGGATTSEPAQDARPRQTG